MGDDNAKPGKADIAHIGRHRNFAEIVKVGTVKETPGFALCDEIDFDGHREKETAMEGLECKADHLVCPDRSPRPIADSYILIVAEITQRAGNIRRRRREGLFCERPRLICHHPGLEGLGIAEREAERGRLLCMRSLHSRPCGEAGKSQFQNFATL